MKKYHYLENVAIDVYDYAREHGYGPENYSREELEELLNDECFTADAVTGNGSGLYYDDKLSERCLYGNWDLLAEALEDFGDAKGVIRRGPAAMDVTIRCYVLPCAVARAVEELFAEFEEMEECE